jgi:AcrR family transcriptional regulator
MSTGYELEGRVEQKQRTRDALVAAARALVADGETPTVDSAAVRARVSRTTAYRYFSDQASLLAAAHPEIAVTSLLPDPAPVDVADRLAAVVERVTDLVMESEAQQRTMLRLSLERGSDGRQELLLRQGRVIGWLEDALAPLVDELGQRVVRQLSIAIRSAIGIEAYVWLTDVARLPPAEAVGIMRWSARSMLDAARNGSPPPVSRGGRRSR